MTTRDKGESRKEWGIWAVECTRAVVPNPRSADRYRSVELFLPGREMAH